jgi:hypothetical protein
MKPANLAPVYVCIYPALAELCRESGYALAIHGSVARDFDLIAVPWIDNPKQPSELIDLMEKEFVLKVVGDRLVPKKHGRLCTTFIFLFGECFLDFSIMEPKNEK